MIYSKADVERILDEVVKKSKEIGQRGFKIIPFDVQLIVDKIKETL